MALTPSQQQAVDCQGRPLFIQAGAGTGKTFTLTKRIAHGLGPQSGPAIESVANLLVITFTEKATGELLARIRGELRKCGLDDAALHVDGAFISTIHGMCSRFLAAHALEAGIDPQCPPLSETESADLLDQVIDELLCEHRDDARLALLMDVLGGAGAAVAALRKMVSLLTSAPNGASDFCLGPQPSGKPVDALRAGLECAESCAHALEELGVRQAQGKNIINFMASLDVLIAHLESIDANACSWSSLAASLGEVKVPAGGNTGKEYKETCVDFKERFEEVLLRVSTAALREATQASLELGVLAYESFGSKKRELGVQDTDDLLAGAYRLLRDNPSIAADYAQRFTSIMVDEFQDTDALQVGIIRRLCSETLSTLATVGDAQQSIYGFRNADLEVYYAMRDAMKAQDSCEVSLLTNYRSHSQILAFVEAIFGQQEFFGSGFFALQPGPANDCDQPWAAASDPRVRLLVAGGRKEGRRSTSSEDLRAAEAELIAEQFAQLGRDGASWGDMAILMFSTKSAGVYVDALRARGIPAVISGGSSYFAQPEVVALTQALRVLALRDDDEALLQVLASPLFDVPDDDLLSLRLISRREFDPVPWDPRPRRSLFDALELQVSRLPHDAADPLVHAYDVLSEALRASKTHPLSQVLARMVQSSGWLAALSSQGAEGEAVAANLQRFYDLCAEYESANGHSVYGAAEHMRAMCGLTADGKPARGKLGKMVAPSSAAVRIMTIHASKGLEFPIVAVCQHERSQARRGAGELVSLTEDEKRYLFTDYAANKLGAAASKDAADSFSAATGVAAFAQHGHALNIERAAAEQQRLLYVALTRARDLLLFVNSAKTFMTDGQLQKGSMFAAMVPQLLGGTELPKRDGTIRLANGQVVEVRVADVPVGDADAPEEGEEAADKTADEPQALASRTHVVPLLHEPPRLKAEFARGRALHSYSSITAAAAKEQPAEEPASFVALRGEREQAQRAMLLGDAFHVVAQWLALQGGVSGGRVQERIEVAAQSHGLTQEESQRLRQAVDVWMNSTRFKQAFGCAMHIPEAAFCVSVGGLALEGSFDLLAYEPQGGSALIIDYKTGTSGAGEELRQRYRLQAQCYAYAALAGAGFDAVELAFVRPEAGMEEVIYSFSAQDVPALEKAILAEDAAGQEA